MDPDIPYLLLTPGPLTTSRSVRAAMQCDSCTWDNDYNSVVSSIREQLVGLALPNEADRVAFTAVLMQGSGTFAVEACIGSAVPADGKILIVDNGAYGRRIEQIAKCLRIDHTMLTLPETESASAALVAEALRNDALITHVACVHCETTTGMLNPVRDIGHAVRDAKRIFIVDAMSSFGGVPIDLVDIGADFLVSSANKCIQGVPGFGFVIARRDLLKRCEGNARSLSLDLYAQWYEMEAKGGKWRYTSPTHVVLAFAQALRELEAEGGIAARHARYRENQRILKTGMRELGFETLLPDEVQSPIITAFHYPLDGRFQFETFYDAIKARRYVIYPGKVSHAETFRVGNIGHVFADDFRSLVREVAAVIAELGIDLN